VNPDGAAVVHENGTVMPASDDPQVPVAPDAVLRALADPHRREIVRLVRDAEMPAGQIAASFPLTQQAVSQHLMVLKRAGLLEERRHGTRRLYRFRPASLEPVRELLDEFWPDALERLKGAVERDHPRKRPKKGTT
jgi:DNA-binding transcriptional ArsR family regulator